MENSPFYKIADRPAPNGPFSSIRYLWTTYSLKRIISPYERPPFPIILEEPSLYDIFRNFQFSDFCMIGMFYSFNFIAGYFISKSVSDYGVRVKSTQLITTMGLVTGLALAFNCSYYRLTGFQDNGLRWKTPDNRMKLFDSTSVYEANTFWKNLRVRGE